MLSHCCQLCLIYFYILDVVFISSNGLAPFLFYCRWGGPLTENWLDKQLMLQKKILFRMIELGMTPGVLQLHTHIYICSCSLLLKPVS